MDRACHIELNVVQTERRNHAKEIVAALGPGEYQGIISVSGDGLIHEIVNAIMCRPDREEFLKFVTLGIIPAGTSNGFYVSMADQLKETGDPVYVAAFLIAKGRK